MSSGIVEQGGAAVTLGHTAVDLKVRVKRSEVICTLKHRGVTVNVVFGADGVNEVLLPSGSSPEVRERWEGEEPGGHSRK